MRARKLGTQARVVRFLRRAGGYLYSPNAIASRLKMTSAQVRSALRGALRKGLVYRQDEHPCVEDRRVRLYGST